MKIVDYKILSYFFHPTLEKTVRDYIENGWQPFGNVYPENIRGENCYSQAMVKYEDIGSENDKIIKDLYLRIEALEKLVTPKVSFNDLKSSNWEDQPQVECFKCKRSMFSEEAFSIDKWLQKYCCAECLRRPFSGVHHE